MANVRGTNTIYVDSTGDISSTASSIVDQILLTATSANAVLVLRDQTSGNPIKVDLRVATSGETKSFEMNRGILFTNGINIGTITNAVATLIYKSRGDT